MRRTGKLRTVLVVMFLLASISLAGAEGFGVYSSEKTKTMDNGTAEFELFLINPDDQPQNLQVSASEIEGGNLWIEKGSISRRVSGLTATIQMESSKPVTSGENLVQLGDGNFVNTTRLKLVFEAEGSERDRYDFDIDLRQQFESEERTNLSQDVVNVRTYSYTVLGEESFEGDEQEDSIEPDPEEEEEEGGQGAFQDFFQGVDEELDIQFGDDGEDTGDQSEGQERDSAGEEEEEAVTENGDESGQESPAADTETQRSKKGGPDTVTYILGAAVLASVVYLLRVM